MKKKLALLLSFALCLSLLAGCGQQTAGEDASDLQNEYTPNLLTGEKQAADYDAAKRPVAIMINNIYEALPQRGIGDADLIYEMVTEGGITRLMAVYSDASKIPDVGPVRSARDQHVQMMLPLEAIYVHIGSSSYADEMLTHYKYENREIDGKKQDGLLWYDEQRAKTRQPLHCWYTNAKLISECIEKYQVNTQAVEKRTAFDFVPYDEAPRTLTGGNATGLTVRFSGYDTTVFNYKDGQYYKSQFGEPQIDENSGEQLAFKNLLVLFTTVDTYPDGVLAHVELNFGGVGYYLCNGRYEKVRWMKGWPEQMLRIVTMDGTETNIKINPGKTYVAVVSLNEFEGCQITADGTPVIDRFTHDSSLKLEAD